MNEESGYIQLIISSAVLQRHPSLCAEIGHNEICGFLEEKGFEWKRYSDFYVYVSKDEMPIGKFRKTMRQLIGRNPWLNKCLRKIPVSRLSVKPVGLADFLDDSDNNSNNSNDSTGD